MTHHGEASVTACLDVDIHGVHHVRSVDFLAPHPRDRRTPSPGSQGWFCRWTEYGMRKLKMMSFTDAPPWHADRSREEDKRLRRARLNLGVKGPCSNASHLRCRIRSANLYVLFHRTRHRPLRGRMESPQPIVKKVVILGGVRTGSAKDRFDYCCCRRLLMRWTDAGYETIIGQLQPLNRCRPTMTRRTAIFSKPSL